MENHQGLHHQILTQIHPTIKTFLAQVTTSSNPPTPIRILGDTPTILLDSTDYLHSIREIATTVQDSIHECHPDAHTRFLAVNVYRRHSYFVVDVNHVHYDYETAHVDTAPVPVYVFRLSRRPRIFRCEDQDGRLAVRLAEMHNGHGRDSLPLFDNFTKLVQYHSPRSLKT